MNGRIRPSCKRLVAVFGAVGSPSRSGGRVALTSTREAVQLVFRQAGDRGGIDQIGSTGAIGRVHGGVAGTAAGGQQKREEEGGLRSHAKSIERVSVVGPHALALGDDALEIGARLFCSRLWCGCSKRRRIYDNNTTHDHEHPRQGKHPRRTDGICVWLRGRRRSARRLLGPRPSPLVPRARLA